MVFSYVWSPLLKCCIRCICNFFNEAGDSEVMDTLEGSQRNRGGSSSWILIDEWGIRWIH